jgi:hypothetical protein
MKSDEFVPGRCMHVAGCGSSACGTLAAMLSECSRSLQFGAAFLAEGAQRIYRMAVHQRS